MTTHLTLAEVQAILCYRSRKSASNYIKANRLPYVRRNQAMLIKAEPFFRHLESVTMNEGRTF